MEPKNHWPAVQTSQICSTFPQHSLAGPVRMHGLTIAGRKRPYACAVWPEDLDRQLSLASVGVHEKMLPVEHEGHIRFAAGTDIQAGDTLVVIATNKQIPVIKIDPEMKVVVR